jgi:5-(carboxyamino)imidazole ribonucleotide synthase
MTAPTDPVSVIEPGATIGVLGSGQLGRMFAIAAKQMGYRVHVFSPSHDSPAGQVADVEIQAPYGDLEAVERFAKQVDVITLEFENVPVETINVAAKFAPVRPGAKVLEATQNRIKEKTFLRDNGLPVGDFKPVRSLDELKSACENFLPAVLKTTTLGYDGKGQTVIRQPDEIESAWNQLNTSEAILEEFIDFEFEFSVIGARNMAGLFAAFQPIENEHRNHILDVSLSPSRLAKNLATEATKIVYDVMEQLDAVGVLCVEFFMARDGRILVNEIAPRPHNSGHLTIDAHETSQFEQQVRAVCGLMLGSTRQLKPAAMVNLLGDCWGSGQPKWTMGLSLPTTKLHLYGKSVAKPGRKMGHVTALGDTTHQAVEHAQAARKLLKFDLKVDRSGSNDSGGKKSQPVTPIQS